MYNILSTLKKKLYRPYWNICIRKCKQGTILEQSDVPFMVIANNKFFWFADPFVFVKNGKCYILAEKYSFFSGKGSIAITEYKGKKKCDWKTIIKEPFHLSFPYIYEVDNEIYIVPESSNANALYRYRATNFPYRWEREVLIPDICLSDSVFIPKCNNTIYSLMYNNIKKECSVGIIIEIDDVGDKYRIKKYNKDTRTKRAGGNFFYYDGNLIRVAQNCEEFYGKELIFLKLIYTGTEYLEEEILILSIEDINLSEYIKNKIGIHTYNCCDGFEVIDVKSYQFNIIDSVRYAVGKAINSLIN